MMDKEFSKILLFYLTNHAYKSGGDKLTVLEFELPTYIPSILTYAFSRILCTVNLVIGPNNYFPPIPIRWRKYCVSIVLTISR